MSIDRRSWNSETEYINFLDGRKVDSVIVSTAYDRRYGTNEHHLLRQMTAGTGACATLVTSSLDYDVFSVTPSMCP